MVLHWSTTKTLAQIYNTFMGSRKASAHFGIGEDGEIWQFVDDRFIAWHAGDANRFNIGIEHCGGYRLPDGSLAKPTQACHDASVELIKFLSDKHGIEISGETIKGHKEFMATACPGSLDIQYIIFKANSMNTFEDFKNWNNDIKDNGLVAEVTRLETSVYNIPLVKDVDNLTNEQKDFLIKLKDFNDSIPEGVRNTEWLDTIMQRYGAVYFLRSSGR